MDNSLVREMSLSTAIDTKTSTRPKWLEWWPVLAGLLVLYAPTVFRLYHGLWNQDAHAHGPIILGIVVWLFWRSQLQPVSWSSPLIGVWSGWLAFGLGLMTYALGRSQGIMLLEAGSILPVAGGLIVSLRGWQGLKHTWFPLFFLVFFIPLPGFVIAAMTGALKPAVSAVSEMVLSHAGYPVARSGVMLFIGPYQLLVADACSGLNSMVALSAMGLLYLYLMRHKNRLRNAILLASILPVAFVANIVRVVALMLLTYHAGDEAGQSFLHNFSGLTLFLAALAAFIGLDNLLGRLILFRDEAKRA